MQSVKVLEFVLIFRFVDYVGRALCLALGPKGVFVTVVDFNEERGKEVASLFRKKVPSFIAI